MLPQDYEELHHQYASYIRGRVASLNCVYKHSEEDVYHYVWMSLLQARFLERFNSSRDATDDALRKYLYIALRNSYLNFCRTQRRRYSREDVVAPKDAVAVSDGLVENSDVVVPNTGESLVALKEAHEVLSRVLYPHVGDLDLTVHYAHQVFEGLARGRTFTEALKQSGLPYKVRKQICLSARAQYQELSPLDCEEHSMLGEPNLSSSLPQVIRMKDAPIDRWRSLLVDQVVAVKARAVAVAAEALGVQAAPPRPPPVMEVVAPVPEPERAVEPEPISAPAPEPVVATAPAEAKREVAPAPPVPVPVPERFATLMGNKVWDCPSLEKKLIEANDEIIKSNNPRSYILSVWATASVRVPGPNGDDLRNKSGKIIKAHKFTCEDRGRYRVATPEEIQAEARRMMNMNPNAGPQYSDDKKTPADRIFEEQGINIRPALQPTQQRLPVQPPANQATTMPAPATSEPIKGPKTREEALRALLRDAARYELGPFPGILKLALPALRDLTAQLSSEG
jgi:DNA-directed RNA polymerase specialized sigma24 family protein